MGTPADVLGLAQWIQVRAGGLGPMTHLKLQKLAFYSYGAAVAHDLEGELGHMLFEPWAHGPVHFELWRSYRAHGKDELPTPHAPRFQPGSERLREVLEDTVDVYGRLSAWDIRCETHLEEPWIEAYQARSERIDPDRLRDHFRAKFRRGHVRLPAYLSNHASSRIDLIPPARFESLHEMASMLRRSASRR